MSCVSEVVASEIIIDDDGNIDCYTAKQILAKLYAGTAAISSGKTYKWGERQITKSDAAELKDMIRFYRGVVSQSCGGKNRGINVRYVSMPDC